MKRGISPLIATVLIIGFTVALAAIIMKWGSDFTKEVTEDTSSTAGATVMCATDVSAKVTACYDSTDDSIKLTVENNGQKKIDKFRARFFENLNTAGDKKDIFNSTGIESYGIGTESISFVSGITLSNVREVSLIPIVTEAGNEVTCSNAPAKFGDRENDNSLESC